MIFILLHYLLSFVTVTSSAHRFLCCVISSSAAISVPHSVCVCGGTTVHGFAFAKTLASLASGLPLALASKIPIIPKGVPWEWLSANGA